MRILGVDPGYRAMGIAVVDCTRQRPRVVVARTVRTSTDQTIAVRMRKLHRELRAELEYRPQCVVAWEAQHRTAVAQSKRGASNADALRVREVVGMLWALAFEAGGPVEVEPAQVRRAVGCGASADKKAVKRAVRLLCDGVPKLLSHHASDAIAIAIGGARYHNQQRSSP